jgi:hypothetical protein
MSSEDLGSVAGLLRSAVREDEDVSLAELLQRTGAEAFGPSILVLALLSMVPYTSILTGAGIMVLGWQMVIGSRKSWLPGVFLRWRMRGRHVRASLAHVERWVKFLGPHRPGKGRVNGRLIGGIVLWTAFLLILPLPLIPFANVLPAVGLVLLGLAAMEGGRPSLVGFGGLLSLAGTAYFLLLGQGALAVFERFF